MAPGFDGLETALADRYRIERELGQGGMATVYLARDLKHDRQVAVKVLKPDLAAVIGAERFLAEITTTANLQHPQILPLFDSGQADTFLYYVMPYVDGETLRHRLDREKQIPLDDAVRIATDVAEALEHAHGRGVIHRDIKPANILLQEGRALVADFGVALAVSAAGGDRLTETGTSLGTPHYMSPEQATADSQITGRSDLYSLGAVLYEMLTGDPPHTGPNSRVILTRILTEDPRPVSETRRSTPAHIVGVVSRALEKLPADRFGSGAELGRALTDPGFRWPLDSAVGSPDARRGALAAVVVALVAFGVWGWLRPGTSPPVAAPSQETEISLPDGVSLALTGGNRYPLALSRDGQRIVFSGQEGRETRLYLRELGDLTARPIPGTEDARQPFFSPDGEDIGFFAGTGLWRVSLWGDTPPTRIAEVPPFSRALGRWFGATWGDDGTILYSLGTSLLRVPADGGRAPEEIPLSVASEDDLRRTPSESEVPTPIKWPHFLPGATHALISAGWTDQAGGAGIVDLASGRFRTLLLGGEPHFLPAGYLLLAGSEERLTLVSFDPDRLEVRGAPLPVREGVVRGPGGGATTFAISENGTLVYAPGGFERWLVLVGRGGREDTIDVEPRGYRLPDVAPDGRTLAVTVDPRPSETWIIDLDRPSEDLFLTGDGHHVGPAWSPDGSRISFGTGEVIFVVDWPGDGTRDSLGISGDVSWIDDGTLVQTATNEDTGRDLHVFDLRTRTSRALVRGPGDQFGPEVSPGAEWVAFVGDQTGAPEIYVSRLDAPGRSIPISRGGGEDPVWSVDGGELFYRAGTWIVAVGVRTEPTFQIVSPPDSLFQGPYLFNQAGNWDVLTDGRFVMIRGDADIGRRLVYVTNWLEEVTNR